MPNASKYLLILARGYPPAGGGLEAYAALLAEGLAKTRPVKVITFFEKDQQVSTGTGNPLVRPLKVSQREFINWWRMSASLLGLLLPHGRPTSVVAVSWKVGLAYAPIRWLVRRPLLVIAHGAEVTRHASSRLLMSLMRHVFKKADRIVAISSYTAKVVQQFAGTEKEKITVINNGINVGRLHPVEQGKAKKELGLQDRLVIVTVARVERRKGHELVLRQMPNLLRKFPNLTYCIVGDGSHREHLENLCQELELDQPEVIFAGRVDEKVLDLYYSACDLFVMLNVQVGSKDFEGFGFVFAEAGYFGKPCLAGDNAGVRDVIEHGKTGYLVDTDDDKQISHFLEKLCADAELRESLGESAREKVLSTFTVERMVKDFDDLISVDLEPVSQ